VKTVPHWIDGSVVESTSGITAPVFDPATGQQTAEVGLASVADVDAAVAAARAAFPGSRSTSLSRRAEVMFQMRELVDANRKEIASLVTAEHGKVLGASRFSRV
jgi:malonate-semialdehyde dehydrogenase (acetylating) / methylmalonate-semialdehyde dehydrogenase